jgi:hypothetical protein
MQKSNEKSCINNFNYCPLSGLVLLFDDSGSAGPLVPGGQFKFDVGGLDIDCSSLGTKGSSQFKGPLDTVKPLHTEEELSATASGSAGVPPTLRRCTFSLSSSSRLAAVSKLSLNYVYVYM